MADVTTLLRNGAPNTLFSNLLERANDGVYEEVIVMTLDRDGTFQVHWSSIANNLRALGLLEACKEQFLEHLWLGS
jgi:hypothetical protein